MAMTDSEQIGHNFKTIFIGNHSSSLLHELNRERLLEDNYCDVVLCVGDKEFLGHRCVIGQLSKMLDKMFKIKMKEKTERKIVLKEVDADGMILVMEYIYTARITVNKNNAMQLLTISDYLQIDALKEHCIQFFVQGMKTENILSLKAAADMYHERTLKKNAEIFVSTNIENIVHQQEFKEFTLEDVLAVLESRKSKRDYEELAYDSFVKWAEHDRSERKSAFEDLLRTLKLYLLPLRKLEEAAKQPLITESHTCKDFLIEQLLLRLKLPPPVGAKIEEANLFVFHGPRRIKLFDVKTMLFSDLPDFPHDCSDGCVVAACNKLYVIGGDERPRSILSLHHSKPGARWKQVGSTIDERCGAKATFHNGLIYIVGGNTSSVECFDPAGDVPHCVKTASVSHAYYRFAITDYCGHLVCGGERLRDQYMECLNDVKGEWESVFQPIPLIHSDPLFATSGVDLYALGADCETYRLHPVFKRWDQLSTTLLDPEEDSIRSALVADEKLFILIQRFEEWNLHVFDCKTKQTRVEEVHWNWEFGFDEPSVTAICCS